MLHQLKRHPFTVEAHFGHTLVLTYALPHDVLTPLLPPGLTVDAHGHLGFVAIALVQTRRLRPVVAPRWLGQDFFLAGYRIFARFRTPQGRTLRGLRILRSLTDRPLMKTFGNLLTHYNYELADVRFNATADQVSIAVTTPRGDADLEVVADLTSCPAPLPSGTPFAGDHDARRFAGPLPYTFDYERQTHSIVVIKGVRAQWEPRQVRVHVSRNTFFDQPPFAGAPAVLASAFHLKDVAYRWERGVRYQLAGATA